MLKIFKNLFVDEKEKELVNIVRKIHNTEYGMPFDIYEDLGVFIDTTNNENESPLCIMAYAYARRCIVDLMYLEGTTTNDIRNYNLSLFKVIQTNTTKKLDKKNEQEIIYFQEQAFNQAIKFLNSYNQHYNKLLFAKVAMILMSKDLEYVLFKIRNSYNPENRIKSHENTIEILTELDIS